MKAISAINALFVPLGMKPIEDLPKALPGCGHSCVIAAVLKEKPEWDGTFVGRAKVNLMSKRRRFPSDETPYESDEFQHLSDIELPLELQEFIDAFDDGEYPDLVDLEQFDNSYAGGNPVMVLTNLQRAGIDIGTRLDDALADRG